MALAHGKACVQSRFFSINKSLLVENMLEKSIGLISQQHGYDEIHEAGGIKNKEISKKNVRLC